MASPLVQALAYQNSVNPVPSQVSPTNVVGAYQLASNVAEQNYAEQIARNNAFWGGLAGLGGAGILAFGKPLGTKLFGGATTPAATPGATSGAGATSPLAAVSGGDVGTGGGILTGGDALGIAPADFAAASGAGDASLVGPLSTLGQEGATAASLPLGFGSIAGDLGTAGAGDALGAGAGSVAADLGAGAAGDALAAGGTDLAAATAPDWLAALLPFLA